MNKTLEELVRLYWYASFPIISGIEVPISSIKPEWLYDPELVERRARAYVDRCGKIPRVGEWDPSLEFANLFLESYEVQGERVLIPKIEPLEPFSKITLPNVTLVWVIQPETCGGLDLISREDIVSALPRGIRLTEVSGM